MKNPVISRESLPVRAPLTVSVLMYLLLDRVHAPGWVWGIVATIVVALWFNFFVYKGREVEVPLSELRKGP